MCLYFFTQWITYYPYCFCNFLLYSLDSLPQQHMNLFHSKSAASLRDVLRYILPVLSHCIDTPAYFIWLLSVCIINPQGWEYQGKEVCALFFIWLDTVLRIPKDFFHFHSISNVKKRFGKNSMYCQIAFHRRFKFSLPSAIYEKDLFDNILMLSDF